MANIHRTPEQWQQIFAQHAASGLQITAFCKQQNLNPSSFYAWRKRLENYLLCASVADKAKSIENNPPDWVDIIPEKIAVSSCWDIELSLPNGVVLRMMNS
ncbi:MAG: transposase [Colwellia sp.]